MDNINNNDVSRWSKYRNLKIIIDISGSNANFFAMKKTLDTRVVCRAQ